MSKTAIPFLFVMVYSTILGTCTLVVYSVLMFEQNAAFWKQVRSSIFSGVLKQVVSHIRRDGSSDVDLHQQEARTLVSKGALYSNRLQRFNNCNGFELSKWMAKNGVLHASNFSKELQECRFETGYKTEQLEMAVVPLKNLLKVLESPKPTISDPCFPQMPLDMISAMNQQTARIFELKVELDSSRLQKFNNCNGLESSKSIGKNGVGLQTISSKGLQERHAETGSDPMKLLEICCWCQEMISKKKFFDERRFGILRQCDCIICYGCIRKVTSTSGVVNGPVCCPLCYVESDTVAASARWIKGEEKLEFFETYSKIMGQPSKYGQDFIPEPTTSALYSKIMEQRGKYGQAFKPEITTSALYSKIMEQRSKYEQAFKPERTTSALYSKSMEQPSKYGQVFIPERTTLALYSKSMEQPSKYEHAFIPER